MINQYGKKKKGFTLVETLVAISILMISIAGPMVLVGNGIRSSAFARDQVTAFYLAQDAIEAMRYIRDNNRIDKVLSSNPDFVPWDEVTAFSNCTAANPCGIDTYKVYNRQSNPIAHGTADDFLTLNSQGIYGYSTGGQETRFKRHISIESIDDAREVQIIVTVDWSTGLITRKFSIRENLFYWY